MKTNLTIIIIGSMLTMSCSTVNMTYTSPNSKDDLYYSKADAQREVIYHEEVKVQDMSKENSNGYSEEPQVQNRNAVGNTGESYSNGNGTDAINSVESGTSDNNLNNPNYSNGNAEQSYSSDGKTIINNYYGDVYDDDGMGYYSTRIHRFHRPYSGFNYYSPAYCGFYYDPFYSSGWNFGIGFGYSYGYYDPFFNPFYNPWYSPYSPYYGYGGWGYNNYDAYRWGYNNGYWDGRNDNGYYGGGYYSGSRGGTKNTIIRGPRPTRGGTVSSAGGRVAPERGSVPSAGSGSESIRSAPPTRSPINSNSSNKNTTNTNTNTEIRTAPTREPVPVKNNSGNGYVPPRLPSATQGESSPSSGSNNQTTPRSETIIRNNNSPNPQPIKVNPNYGGQSSSPNIRRSEDQNIRKSENQNIRRSETPRASTPSRSSAPSSPAPSRSNSGNSAPSSRPRPR